MEQQTPQQNMILGMIMLADEVAYDVDRFFEDLQDKYEIEVQDPVRDQAALIIGVNGITMALAHVKAPIPSADIESTTQYAYNWPSAVKDLQNHKSHIIVNIFSSDHGQVERFKTFSMVVSSLLRTTPSLGVYMGTQSLLITKIGYLEEASLMDHGLMPLNLWVYFGIRVSVEGTSGYTYGLNIFDKPEMEILNSAKKPMEVRNFLFYLSHFILTQNIVLKDGETCGINADETVAITASKGVMVEGETLKLEY
jgi:hypothetical protein